MAATSAAAPRNLSLVISRSRNYNNRTITGKAGSSRNRPPISPIPFKSAYHQFRHSVISLKTMNQHAKIDIRHSTCPHDCPSACALDIEVIGGQTIGRVRGSKRQSYTAGVVCAKVARYAERIHHPDRLMYPQRRTGPKGSG